MILFPSKLMNHLKVASLHVKRKSLIFWAFIMQSYVLWRTSNSKRKVYGFLVVNPWKWGREEGFVLVILVSSSIS